MNDSLRWLSVCALACVLVALASAGAAGLAADSSQSSLLQTDIDADTVVLAADIDSGGDADWAVEYRLRLDDATDEQAFEQLRADIAANESAYLGPFAERIRTTARAGENATGRTMAVDQFDVSAERREQPQDSFGIVTFEFEWAGFAAVDGDRIRAGDAVEQLFLQAGERLQFSWPETHRLQSATPDPETVETRRVVWRGPVDFGAGEPRIELRPAADGGSATPVWLFGVVVLLAVVAGAGLYWRRRDDPDGNDRPATPAETGGEPEEDGDTPPPELLSNEEQVLQLLEANGGRMKQKALAEELDWSAAKTSQVVGTLRDDDRVESFRLGRENVLTLPGVDIDGESSEDDR